MDIITLVHKRDMTYDFHIKHNMSAFEWKLNAMINEDLTNKFPQDWKHAIYTYYKCEKFLCVCVCIIKLHWHFLPDLAQILNKAMNSKGTASKPVPGADFIQLSILRHLFVSHTQQPIRLRESG